MKTITVTLKVTVDPTEWADTYGADIADVAEDVKRYVRNQVADSAAAEEGCITAVR